MTIAVINARNQFAGTIKHIKRGDIVSEVEVDIGGVGTITSVLTTSSVENLGFKKGVKVLALFKSTEVVLASFGPD
jgi:molybdopterin-binding protein